MASLQSQKLGVSAPRPRTQLPYILLALGLLGLLWSLDGTGIVTVRRKTVVEAVSLMQRARARARTRGSSKDK